METSWKGTLLGSPLGTNMQRGEEKEARLDRVTSGIAIQSQQNRLLIPQGDLALWLAFQSSHIWARSVETYCPCVDQFMNCTVIIRKMYFLCINKMSFVS